MFFLEGRFLQNFSCCVAEERVVNMASIYNSVVDAYTTIFHDRSGKPSAYTGQSVPGLKMTSAF
jgi:hypothetical protein